MVVVVRVHPRKANSADPGHARLARPVVANRLSVITTTDG
jgi:hypothetical protein